VKKFLFVALIVFFTLTQAYADRTITSATVNGLNTVTVGGGTNITVGINVTTTGNDSNARWRSTRWNLSDGSDGCIDHGNYNSSGNHYENFNVTAPSNMGTYDLTLRAYRDNGCSQGQSPVYTLSDAVTVNSVGSFSGTNYKNFTQLFNENLKGDVTIFGNTILGENEYICTRYILGFCINGYYTNSATCPANNANNANIQTIFWDVDNDNGTFNSSSSELNIANGATIKKAYLYWQGLATSDEIEDASTIKLKAPSGSYISLQAQPQNINWSQYGSHYPYQASVEVTEYMNGSGIYTVADLTTRQEQFSGLGTYGAWSIVVVYENEDDTMKNISIYDGYQAIDETNEQSITLSGFLTPTSGIVNSRFIVFAGEGDVDIAGDYIEMDGTKLRKNAQDNGNNAFNASITQNGNYVTDRTPSCQNNMGIDIHTYNVGTNGQGIIGNNQSSTTIKLVSSQDMYFPSVFAFSTELYIPDVCYEEKITINGEVPTQILATDILDMEVYITNKNFEPAKGVSIKRVFSDENEYDRNSTTKYEDGSFVSKTDASGDDIAYYLDDEDTLVINLGTGASAGSGGDVSKDQNETFAYSFSPSSDGNITSAYLVSYRDDSGVGEVEQFNDIPIGKCSDRSITETIIPVEPSGNARIVENGKSWDYLDGGLFTKIVGMQTHYDLLFATDENGNTLTSGEIEKVELVDMLSGDVVETILGATEIDEKYDFSYTFTQAYKKVQFKITLENDEVPAYSNDFTVRPAALQGTIGDVWAGVEKNIEEGSIFANATGYDQTLDLTHITDVTFDASKICVNDSKNEMVESFDLNFTDGDSVAGSVATFKDVGDFNITVNDESWARSSNDYSQQHCIQGSASNTPDGEGKVGCAIQGQIEVTVAPYKLKVVNATFTSSKGIDWLYMSPSFDNDVTVGATVQALNESEAITQNFSNECYAKDVALNFDYSFDANGGEALAVDINASSISGDLNATNFTLDAIDRVVTATQTMFGNGEANVSYSFKVDKKVNPQNPVEVTLDEVQVATTNVAFTEEDFVLPSDGNNTATFYYARLNPKDLTTSKKTDTTSVDIEVYSTQSIDGLHQTSLNWYKFTDDGVSEIVQIKEDTVFDNNISFSGGRAQISIDRDDLSNDTALIHLDIPQYLWYSKEGNAYSFNNDCATNPCIYYQYLSSDGDSGVVSGTFKGSRVDKSDINASQPKGVKIFR
jgi:hypothetical protein